MTEFPEPLGDGGVPEAKRDGGRSGSGASCSTNAQCAKDELCCGNRCVATTPEQCTACGLEPANGCTSERDRDRAPNCGERECECEPGEGPCEDGRVCDNSGVSPKCVECRVDGDCADANTSSDGHPVCVDNRCVACNPADGRGCGGNKPVCTPEGVCDRCKSDDDCPDGQKCNEGLGGCYGCKLNVPINENNCTTPTTPICAATAEGLLQCAACQGNDDCKGGYCYEGVGSCHPQCDPRTAPGQIGNGCTDPNAPICRMSVSGTAACDACMAGDPCPNMSDVCVTSGPNAGRCMPRANTCTGATPVLGPDGQCVACTTSMHCTNPAAPICGPRNTCVPCTPGSAGNAACEAASPARPVCSAAGTCVTACRGSSDCSGTTPVCADRVCVACTSNRSCGDSLICLQSGACAACDPAVPCNAGSIRAGVCSATAPNGPLVCNECTPETAARDCRGLNSACTLQSGRYLCTTPPLTIPGITGPGGLLGGLNVERTSP